MTATQAGDTLYSQTCIKCGHNWRDHPGYSGESACIACVQEGAVEPCREMVSEPLDEPSSN